VVRGLVRFAMLQPYEDIRAKTHECAVKVVSETRLSSYGIGRSTNRSAVTEICDVRHT